MVTEDKKPGFWACTTLILVALLAAAPLWGTGIVNTRGGGDSPFLLQRAHQLVVNLRAGVFPVRWMPDAAYGLGYPFFSYYAALPYYLVGLLALVGLDLLTALKLVQTLGFIAAALAMYGWMRGTTRNRWAMAVQFSHKTLKPPSRGRPMQRHVASGKGFRPQTAPGTGAESIGKLELNSPDRWAAWLAAVAYTVAPFHLVNVYVRGDSLSEFYAFIFYPLILWGLDKIANRKSKIVNSGANSGAQWLWPALAYAGLLLTHNISAMIFSPFALLYLVMLAWREKGARWRIFGLGLLALGFGFLLSAWFWLPAVAELGYVQLGPSTQDYFHYSRHFRTLNLVQRTPLFDYSTAAGHKVHSPFAMGLAQAAFAVLGGLMLAAKGLGRRLDARWWFVLLGLLISTAMVTPLSKPLWDHLPLLPVTQFPWRFLSVQALFTAAATVALVSMAVQCLHRTLKPPSRGRPMQRYTVSGKGFRPQDAPGTGAESIGGTGAESIGGTGAESIGELELNSPVLLSEQRSTRNPLWITFSIAAILIASTLLSLHPDRLPIGPSDVTVERLRLYELFAGNIGTTIRYEWLPNTADPRPFTSDALVAPNAPPRATPLDGASLQAALVEREPVRQTWRVWGGGGGIAFPLLYWPGWEARVDGEPVEVWPLEGSGYLALEAPPGEHTVVLRLGHTPVRAVAEVVSLCTLVVLVVVILCARPKVRWSSVIRHLLFVVLSLLVLLLALSQKPGFVASLTEKTWFLAGSESDLTMDFVQMPYLHHNPDGVDFDSAARLSGYTLSAEELAPGDTLTVTLDWSQMDGACTATLGLVSPAAVQYDVEPLAETTSGLQPSTPIALRLPEDVPRGVYLLQLRVFGPAGTLRARTSSGNGQGDLYLQPVRVPRGPSLPPDVSVLAPFGPAIRLHAVTASQLAPDRLAVKLTWSAAHPVAANYGISLRLLDAGGQIRVQMDTQPGYGFLPTSLWQPGELVTDEYILALPDDLPADAGYLLQVVLYQAPTLEPVGQAQVGGLTLPLETPFEARRPPRVFALPLLQHPLGVDFGGEVRLAGYDLEREENTLRLTLWWQAIQPPRADYTVFVHLFDPDTGGLPAQSDAQPRGGAYPTSWWAEGEVVSETVTLPLADAPDGTYRLAVGLYDHTVTRLRATGPGGQQLPDDRIVLPIDVRVGQ